MMLRILSLSPVKFRATLCLLVGIAVGSVSGQAPAGDLALHLPLTEDLRDHSPASHPIRVVGSVRIEGEGAYFGGRKDWLEAPHIPLHGRPFAVSLWVKPTKPDRQIGFLEQFDLNRPGHHLCLMLCENRQPYLGFYVRDLISPLSTGWEPVWMHLVFQYTGEFQQIWINGRLICSSRSAAYEGTTGVTAIGKTARWSNVRSKDFTGFLRDLRIYQRALNHEEIASLAGPGGFAAGGERNSDLAAKSRDFRTASFAAISSVLPDNPAVPFLEIDGGRITINGTPGTIYALEATTDLSGWSVVQYLTNQTGQVIYQNDQPGVTRFYRVAVEGR